MGLKACRRLGAARHQPHHLQSRHPVAELFGHLDLSKRWGPEAGAIAGRLLNGIDDVRVTVTQDARAVAHHVVDVAVAIDIDQVGARGVVKDVLTKSAFHPHGIKVRLDDGQVGRIKQIIK